MTTRKERFKKAAAEARSSVGIDAINIRFQAEAVINQQRPEYNKDAGTFWTGKDLDAENVTGKRFVADIADVMMGYRKFTDGRVKMPVWAVVAVGGDKLLPERKTLGDTDESKWPMSKYRDGERQDIWKVIWVLPMYSESEAGAGDTFAFSPESNSGINAIANLVDIYAERPDGDNKLPLISLQSRPGSRFASPILHIEGWVDRPAGVRRLTPPPLPIAPEPDPQGELLNGAAMPPRISGDGKAASSIDDDIPF
jgi:hypothetical protein